MTFTEVFTAILILGSSVFDINNKLLVRFAPMGRIGPAKTSFTMKCIMKVLFIAVTNVIIKVKQNDKLNNMHQYSMKAFFITANKV